VQKRVLSAFLFYFIPFLSRFIYFSLLLSSAMVNMKSDFH